MADERARRQPQSLAAESASTSSTSKHTRTHVRKASETRLLVIALVLTRARSLGLTSLGDFAPPTCHPQQQPSPCT